MAGRERYTAQQFIDAMPGTGGVISALANRVGCTWHTAKKYVDEYATVHKAWEAESNRINDLAKYNLVQALQDGDLQISKWWAQVKIPEFALKARLEHTGKDDGPIEVKETVEFDLGSLTDDQLDALASLRQSLVADRGGESEP